MNQRAKRPFTWMGLVLCLTALGVHLTLLFNIANPEPFKKATNSQIVNYGLWFQATTCTCISKYRALRMDLVNTFISFHFSGFLCIFKNIIRHKEMWEVMEKYYRIDQELRFFFNVYVPFGLVKRLINVVKFN